MKKYRVRKENGIYWVEEKCSIMNYILRFIVVLPLSLIVMKIPARWIPLEGFRGNYAYARAMEYMQFRQLSKR